MSINKLNNNHTRIHIEEDVRQVSLGAASASENG